jgi:Cu2+-exporting ATPase
MLRERFWLSLLLTIPTLLWGHMLPGAFRYAPPAIPGDRWIAPVFGTAVFLYGGRPFIQGAIGELRARLPGMMTLITLAISVAFGFSVAALTELAKLLPDTALRFPADGAEPTEVPVSTLRDGDLILVRPGARIPRTGPFVKATAASTNL